MDLSFLDILLIIAIFQLFFLAVFLFIEQRGKRLSNVILGSFFLLLCLNLLDTFLLSKNAYHAHPSLALWSNSFPLLYGPLLYMYTRSVLQAGAKFSSVKWLHLLPFFVVFALMETAYLSLGHATQLQMLEAIGQGKSNPYIVGLSALIAVQFFGYLAASLGLIRRYKAIAGEQFSDHRQVSINWLSSTIIFLTFFLLLFAFHGIIRLTAMARYYPIVLNMTILLLFVFVNRVLFKALQKPEIFSLLNEEQSNKQDTARTKYAASTLTESDKKHILAELQGYMSRQKPYLDAELGIDQLADQLGVKPRALSQVINECLQLSFFEFINQYRIAEAQRMLTCPEDKKITVLEVLYKAGFNSKSSFNTLFKKYTGLTPVEFKKKNTS